MTLFDWLLADPTDPVSDELMWRLTWSLSGALLALAVGLGLHGVDWVQLPVLLFGGWAGQFASRAPLFKWWALRERVADRMFWTTAYVLACGLGLAWSALELGLPDFAVAVSALAGIAAGCELGRFVVRERRR
jgi:hypothetical protein